MLKNPIIIAIAAAVIALGTFVFVTDAPAYGGSAPETCANCHVMDSQYENWYHAPHEKFTECVDCHLPHDNVVVYYLEKGDNRDQVWLTDADGSFHTNLTNDTSTHNYFPSWINEKTIIYTNSPETIMTMNADGTNKQKVEGIKSYLVKFSPAAGLLAYLAPAPESKVLVYDWKKKTSSILLDESVLNTIWK